MSNRVNFNAAALALVSNFTTLRVKLVDGVLMIRPTDRTKGLSNIPKDEYMRPVSYSVQGTGKDARTVKGSFTLPEIELEAGDRYEIERGKYGWYNLLPLNEDDKVGRDTPLVRVSAR